MKSITIILAVSFALGLLSVATTAPAQTVRYKDYQLKASDPTPSKALDLAGSFLTTAGVALPARNTSSLVAEISTIHGLDRPLWRIRYANGIQVKLDMQSRKVVSFHDFGREEAQFKGTQPKQEPVLTDSAEARKYLEKLARKLGYMPDLQVDSYSFTKRPGQPSATAGRADITFKNSRGERVAGISVDLLDGGLNSCWVAPWQE